MELQLGLSYQLVYRNHLAIVYALALDANEHIAVVVLRVVRDGLALNLLPQVNDEIEYRLQEDVPCIWIVVLELYRHVLILNHLLLAHKIEQHVYRGYQILAVLDGLAVGYQRIWR